MGTALPQTIKISPRVTEDEYPTHLTTLSDVEFKTEAFNQMDRANASPIWSDWDQRASQCYTEAVRRERLDLYRAAHKAAYHVAKGDRESARAWEAFEQAK